MPPRTWSLLCQSSVIIFVYSRRKPWSKLFKEEREKEEQSFSAIYLLTMCAFPNFGGRSKSNTMSSVRHHRVNDIITAVKMITATLMMNVMMGNMVTLELIN